MFGTVAGSRPRPGLARPWGLACSFVEEGQNGYKTVTIVLQTQKQTDVDSSTYACFSDSLICFLGLQSLAIFITMFVLCQTTIQNDF